MKHFSKYIILLLFVSILGIVSCNDNAVNDQNQKPNLAQIKAKYSRIGKLHNEGLNYIYESIKNNSASINTPKKLISVINTSGRLFLKNKFHLKRKENKAEKSFSNKLARMINNNDLKNIASNANASRSNIDNLLRMMNKAQKQQWNKLLGLIKNSTMLKTNSNIDSFNKSINKFEQQAASKLDSKKELAPIIIGAIVAQSSMKYWQNNQHKWAVLINNIINENKSKSGIVNPVATSTAPPPVAYGFFSNLWNKIKYVVASDAGGAVTGFMAANLTGCGEVTGESCAVVVGAGLGLAASAGYEVGHLISQ